jgi:hypothetical protein
MKIRKYFIYLFVASIIPLLYSCYPGGSEYYSETDLVITQHDNEFDFSSNKKYFMGDSINHIVEEGKENDVNRKYDAEVLANIAAYLDTAGYIRMEGGAPDSILIAQSDVLISVIATSTEYSGIGYIPGGGGWWGYPGYGWGWGGYYPGYPWYPGYGWGYPYTYSYSTGSLFIEMADLKNIDEDEEIIPIPWQSTINGLLSGDEDNMKWRIDRGIDQSFRQSPYLFTDPFMK